MESQRIELTASIDPATLFAHVRRAVDCAVEQFLNSAAVALITIDAALSPIATELVEFASTGKRMRPLFGYCGWLAAGSPGDESAVVRSVAALELVQVAALIHDDIIDDSESRRGRPTTHVGFEQLHRHAGWAGDGAKFGSSAAIIAGDLALIFADRMLHESGLDTPTLGRVRPVFDQMRVEVMSGQYLDILAQAHPATAADALRAALNVARLKSASYTVARPLHIGAAIADARQSTVAALLEYGDHIGIAFQLRDDILGVFGDPEQTGKPAGDDLREGKRTALIALAQPHLAAGDLDGFGDPDLAADDIDRLRLVITGSGALEQVEKLISEHAAQAYQAIAGPHITDVGRTALHELGTNATARAT